MLLFRRSPEGHLKECTGKYGAIMAQLRLNLGDLFTVRGWGEFNSENNLVLTDTVKYSSLINSAL